MLLGLIARLALLCHLASNIIHIHTSNLGNELFEGGWWKGTGLFVNEDPISKNGKGGDASNTKHSSQLLLCFCIAFCKADVGVGFGGRLKGWRKAQTGSTP